MNECVVFLFKGALGPRSGRSVERSWYQRIKQMNAVTNEREKKNVAWLLRQAILGLRENIPGYLFMMTLVDTILFFLKEYSRQEYCFSWKDAVDIVSGWCNDLCMQARREDGNEYPYYTTLHYTTLHPTAPHLSPAPLPDSQTPPFWWWLAGATAVMVVPKLEERNSYSTQSTIYTLLNTCIIFPFYWDMTRHEWQIPCFPFPFLCENPFFWWLVYGGGVVSR